MCKCLESLMRDFLWEGMDEGNCKGSYLIRWELIKNSLALGSPKIGNLTTSNKALLVKLLWRFFTEPNSLWPRITSCKHDPHPFDWLAKRVKGTYWNLWKDITKELPDFIPWVSC